MNETNNRGRVIADYQLSYPDPFAVAAGEIFQVSEKVDHWNNNPGWVWIWCTDQRDKSGWVPKNAIDFTPDGTRGTARYAYAATELTVTLGDELFVGQAESGWLWCTNRTGKSGWVPSDNIALVTIENKDPL